MDFVELARQAWAAKDYDAARMYYQKASYGIHGTEQANKDAFAQEVAEFAGEDPLYQQGLSLITQYIAQQGKPVLQSDMTAYVKQHWGDAQTELLRYVLYYAAIRHEIYRQKQGRSYLLALSEKDLSAALLPENIKPKAKKTRHLKLFEPNSAYQLPSDSTIIYSSDLAELHREATRYKGEGNWTGALACLFTAKELTHNQIEDFPRRLRLPLFLQQAGHFSAAKYELAYLLENIDRFVELEIKGRRHIRLSKTFVKNHHLERLFDKARLIFQREKQNDLAEACRTLSQEYQQKRIAASEALLAAEQKKRENRREYSSPVSTVTLDVSQIQDRRENTSQYNESLQLAQHHVTNPQKNTGCLKVIIGVLVVIFIAGLLF